MASSNRIKLPRPPTKTEIILYRLARLTFWLGLYSLMVFILVNSGIGTTLTLTIQNIETFDNTTGYLSANSTFFPANLRLEEQPVGKTPLTNLPVEQGNYILNFTPPYTDLVTLKVPISIYPNSITTVKAQIGPYTTASSYTVVYTYPSRGTNLIVYSSPMGATVIKDGEPSGTTPLVLASIVPKTSTLRIEYPGYEPQSVELNILENTTTVINTNLYKKILNIQ